MKRDLLALIREVLGAAGARKPEQTAMLTLQTLAPGSNPFKATKRTPGFLALSTYSERISDTDWEEAVAAATRHLEKLAVRALRDYPADNGVLCAIDTHDAEYYASSDPETSRIRRSLHRQAIAFAATSQNKRALWAHRWLVAALTWTHKGQVVTLPIHVRLLRPGELSPSLHVKAVGQQLRRLQIQVRACLLDRYYQGFETRRICDEYGMDFRIRYTVSPRLRLNVIPEGRPACTLYDLVQQTIGHPEAKLGTHQLPGTRKRVLDFRRVVRVRFPSTQDQGYMAVSASVERDPQQAKWLLREEHCMAVVCRSKLEAQQILGDYRARWRIETFFRALANDMPSPAPKTIPMHCILFVSRLLHIGLASRNLLVARFQAQSGFIHGFRVAQWTICDEASALLADGEPAG